MKWLPTGTFEDAWYSEAIQSRESWKRKSTGVWVAYGRLEQLVGVAFAKQALEQGWYEKRELKPGFVEVLRMICFSKP